MQVAAPGEVVHLFYGATLPIGRAAQILRVLDHNASKGQPEHRPVFRRVANQFREALGRTPEGVSVVNADVRVPPEIVRATEAEEAFHRAMRRATKGQGIDEADARAYLRSSAPIESAWQRVRESRPYLESDTEVADEMAAVLSGGEWDKLGLSASQAEDAWNRFIMLMLARFGETGPEILNYAHPLHSHARERIGESAERAAGDHPSSGLAE